MHEYYALEYEVGFDMPYLIRAQASAIRGLVRLETCKYGVLMEYTWVAWHDEFIFLWLLSNCHILTDNRLDNVESLRGSLNVMQACYVRFDLLRYCYFSVYMPLV